VTIHVGPFFSALLSHQDEPSPSLLPSLCHTFFGLAYASQHLIQTSAKVGLDDIQLAIPYSSKLGEIVDHVRASFGNFRRLLVEWLSTMASRGVSRLSEIGGSGGAGVVPGAANQPAGNNCRA
jgi:hypothetical protein